MSKVQACLELTERHLANARIVPHREAMLPLLPKGGTFVEVGVALGGFTQSMLEVCRPDHFVAIDIFTIHHIPVLWGHATSELFSDGTHGAYYRKRFAGPIAEGRMTVLEGDSAQQLETLADASVDVFYVDADHTYESVCRELAVIKRKVKPSGLIVMNDYTMADVWGAGELYGVIQATHEFMLTEGWEMIYLALQNFMYCDVALRKLPT